MLNNFVGPVSILDYEHVHHIVVFQTRTLFWGYMSVLAGPTLELFGSAPTPQQFQLRIFIAPDGGSPWAPVRFPDCKMQSIVVWSLIKKPSSILLFAFYITTKTGADHISFSASDKARLMCKGFWRGRPQVTHADLLESRRNTDISGVWFFATTTGRTRLVSKQPNSTSSSTLLFHQEGTSLQGKTGY